jgi:hypothetical protein
MYSLACHEVYLRIFAYPHSRAVRTLVARAGNSAACQSERSPKNQTSLKVVGYVVLNTKYTIIRSATAVANFRGETAIALSSHAS